MKKIIEGHLADAVSSILPIFIIILVCSLFLGISDISLISFCMSTILIILGMALFTFASSISMEIIGEKIGRVLVKKSRFIISLLIIFIIGVAITISEPDLQVLASQMTSIPSLLLVLFVGIGVGLFLVLSIIKTKYNLSISHILVISYILLFLMLFFIPNDFIPIAFDSGGVTTGPISVPFIVALGLGLSSYNKDDNDSFGLVALCSIGPIMCVLILSLIFKPNSTYIPNIITEYNSFISLFKGLLSNFIIYFKEVIKVLIPIVLIYILFELKEHLTTIKQRRRIILGFILLLIGLILFLTGVNTGLIPIGYKIANIIFSSKYKYFLIPFGFIIGFITVRAEPAIKVLTDQIEDITSGAIESKTINLFLSIGVGLSVGISFLRALTGLNILYFLIPGYFIAIILTFITPKIFTSIAFDSGGAASGPMTASFLLPMAISVSLSANGNPLTDAFGLISLVAMMPLITIQLLGIIYKIMTIKPINKYYDTSIVQYDWSDIDE